jgi:uncharacterized protein YerC
MRKSNKILPKGVEGQILNTLYQLLADLKNPKEAKLFLEEILTPTELIIFAKRLAAACYLAEGATYQKIKDNLGLSSATIAGIEQNLKKSAGFALALKKIEAEKWASAWAGKIEGFFKKK